MNANLPIQYCGAASHDASGGGCQELSGSSDLVLGWIAAA